MGDVKKALDDLELALISKNIANVGKAIESLSPVYLEGNIFERTGKNLSEFARFFRDMETLLRSGQHETITSINQYFSGAKVRENYNKLCTQLRVLNELINEG